MIDQSKFGKQVQGAVDRRQADAVILHMGKLIDFLGLQVLGLAGQHLQQERTLRRDLESPFAQQGLGVVNEMRHGWVLVVFLTKIIPASGNFCLENEKK
jgi:hypothetical protein